MRTSIFCLSLSLASLGTLVAPPPPAAAYSRVAPADEYFGRLKMSILGIRNQLRDLEVRSSYRYGNRRALMGEAAFIEDAMRDWTAKYPGDPWIPSFRHRLTLCYARIAVMR